MTGDDPGLSQAKTAQWDAIVASEWPIGSAILATQLSSASSTPGACDAVDRQRLVTVYQPRRPRWAPLILGAIALAGCAWLAFEVLAPAYQRAGLTIVSRSERAIAVHDLTVAASLTALAIAAAAGCLGAWAAATSRYLLRRSALRLAAGQSAPITKRVRPPNPATAVTWILLLLMSSAAAGWWIPLQLQRTDGNGLDVGEALHLAALGGWVWLASLLLGAGGLTVWVARESRHQLRRRAGIAVSIASREP
jgi:hypothetical protein